MPTDWTHCDLVEEVSIACIKGTQIPAYFVVAANVGVNVGVTLSEVDKTVVEQIADYRRDSELPIDDWSNCDAVEVKPLVCVKGTNLPVYLALYNPYSEMVEGRVTPVMIEQLAAYDSEHFGEPVWTDQSITLGLGADEVDLIYRALSGMDDSELLEKLGLDVDEDEVEDTASITVTHHEAELIRGSIEFLYRATLPTLETRSDLHDDIATLLYVKGIAPMPSL